MAIRLASSVVAQTFVDILFQRGLLTDHQRRDLSGHDLVEVDRFAHIHHINPALLAKAYADYYKLPFGQLTNLPIEPSVVRLLPEDVARHYKVVPFAMSALELKLAIGDPARLQENAPAILVKLRQQKGLRVNLVIVTNNQVTALLDKVYRPSVKPPPPTKLWPSASQPLASPVSPSQVAAPAAVASLPSGRPVAKQTEKPSEIDLTKLTIAPAVLNKIPAAVAKRYQLIVFDYLPSKSKFESSIIKVAAVRPDDSRVKEVLAFIESRNKVLLDRYRTSMPSFEAAFRQYEEADEGVTISEVEQTDKSAPTEAKSSAKTPAESPAGEPKPSDASQSAATAASVSSAAPAVGPATKQETIKQETASVVSAKDIINQPSAAGQSPEELERLAKEQQDSTENRNLDSLIRKPILNADDLAEVYKGGVIPEIVAATLFLAIRMKASDIHLEAEQETVRVRFRVDGILHDVIKVPLFLHAPLVSRIKILSKLKIDEQRIPQDGRFDVIIDNRQVDLRVSTLPTVHGEKVVLRLLDKSAGILTLEQLGVTGSNFDTLVTNINKPYGIILSTGPTGSGKSTTLYAILARISKPEVNIITLEDPVEYELEGLNQAQVKPQIGFTFADGLRSVLRQDPNIIMVGEIRDLETAAMATHAALTGHLVLSTLHTNDASGALPRLIDMGVEPFLITSSINAVIGQRLVRKICDNCRERVNIPPTVLEHVKKELADLPSGFQTSINLEQLAFYHGKSCNACTNGYSGRIGIYEVLAMSPELEELAVRKAPASEIKKEAIKSGMITMSQDGLIKALKGITTIDEVLRVTTTEIKEVPGV